MKKTLLITGIILSFCLTPFQQLFAQTPAAAISAVRNSICMGESVTLNVLLAGTAPFAFTYTDGTTTKTVNNITQAQLVNGKYSFTETPSTSRQYILTSMTANGVSGSLVVDRVWINVGNPASASISSLGSNMSCSGTTVTFNLSYAACSTVSWEYSTDNGATYQPIVGASGSSVSMVLDNTGTTVKNYYIRATQGVAGNQSTTPAYIQQVYPVLKAGTVQASQLLICNGQQVTLSSSGQAGNVTWERSYRGVWSSTGQTGSTITATLYNSPDPIQFRASYSYSYPSCGTVYSNVVEITVQPPFMPSTIPLASLQTCNGESLTVTANYGGALLQWEQSDDQVVFSDISGATTSTLSTTFSNTGTSAITKYLRIRSYQPGCAVQYSNIVPCTINPTPSVGTISTPSSSLCGGSQATLSVGSFIGSQIKWYTSNDNVTFVDMWANNSATINTNNLYVSVPNITYYYKAVVSSSGCTSTATSGTVPVTIYQNVYPAGYPNEMYSAINVCTGSSATLKVNPPTLGTVQWTERVNGNYIDIPGANGLTYQTPALINTGTDVETRYYAMYLINGACRSYMNADIIVKVYPGIVTGNIQAAKNPVCKGGQTTVSISGANAAGIKWYYSSDGGQTFLDAYQDNKVSFLTNPVFPTAQQPYVDYIYKASVSSAGCPSSSTASYTLRTLNMSSGIYLNHPYPQSISLCEKTNGELININTSSTIYGTYSWQTSSDNVSFSDIPGTDNLASYALPAYTNTGTSPQIFYYRAKLVIGTTCSPVYSTAYTVTINPKPAIGTLSVSSDKICSESSVTLTLTSNSGPVTWYKKDGTSLSQFGYTQGPSATGTLYAGYTSNSTDFELYAEASTPACPTVRSNSVHTIVYQPAFHNYSSIIMNTCKVVTSGTQVSLGINGSPIGDHYDWLVQYPGTTSYVFYKSTTVPQLTTDPLLNLDGNSLNYAFKVVVYNGACTASSPIGGVASVKVIPDVAHTSFSAPANICGAATSFPLSIKDYGQTTLTLYKLLSNGNTNIVPVTFTKVGSDFTATVPVVAATTTYTLVSFYPSNCGGGFGTQFIVNYFGTTPSAPVSITGNTEACQGVNPVNYSVPLQSSALSYEWQVTPATSGTFTTNGNNLTLIPDANFTGTCSISCRAVNTCGASSYTSKSLVVNPTPTVQFVGLPTGVCVNTDPVAAIQLNTNVTGAVIAGDPNVSNGKFYPIVVGQHTVTYTYSDPISGCGVSGGQTIEVFPLPVVSAGADVSVCLGNSVTLSGAGAQTYEWNKNVSDAVSFAPQISATYTVTGTSLIGCKASDDVLVTVNTTSAPTSIIGSDKACHGDVSLAYSVPVQTDALSYEWQLDPASAGTLVSNNNTVSMSLDAAFTGNLSIQCRTINGCGASTYTSKSIVVNTLPYVQFIGLPAGVCLNTDPAAGIQLITNVTGAIINGDPDISNSKFYPVTVGQHAPVYTYTDPNTGCTSIGAQIIEVYPLPVVSAGVDVTVCKGSSVTLHGSGTFAYTWNNNVLNNVSFIPVSTTTYTVTGNTAYGCTSTDDVTVTVNALPQPQILGLSAGYCQGAVPVTLSSNLSGGTFAGSGISGNVFTPSSAGNKTITYSYTDANGCTGVGSASTTVQGSIQQPFLCAQEQGWCSPSTVNICIFDFDPRTAHFNWYDSNLSPVSGVVGNTLPFTSVSTTYYVSSVTQYGCESQKTTVPVHIGAPVVNPIQTCSGHINLNSYVQSPVYTDKVRFLADPKGKTLLNASSYNATVSTTIYAATTFMDMSGNQCSSILTPVSVTVLGCSLKSAALNDVESQGINVYPVPATTEISVSGLVIGRVYRAEIFNSTGESVSVTEVSSNGEESTLDIQDLAQGIYQVVFSNGKERHVMRMVKE